LIFFVYPDPKGSEENQFTPLGDGVNKLIFERWVPIFSIYLIALRVIKLEVLYLIGGELGGKNKMYDKNKN
jgi:hypothetical protein